MRVGVVAWVQSGLQPLSWPKIKKLGGEDYSAIAAALATVSLGDVLGWFEHAGVTNHSF